MRIVNKIADWYEMSGWRTLRVIALIFSYIGLFLNSIGGVVVGIVLAAVFEEGWIAVVGIFGGAIMFFVCAFATGLIKGEIQFFDSILAKCNRATRAIVKQETVAKPQTNKPIEQKPTTSPFFQHEESKKVSSEKFPYEAMITTAYFGVDDKVQSVRLQPDTPIIVVGIDSYTKRYNIEFEEDGVIRRVNGIPSFYFRKK